MKLNLVEHSMEQFSASSEDGKKILGEASSMMNRHLERIYDDAMDVGFKVKLDGGEVVTFVMTDSFDHNDELAGWNYTISSESVRRYPHCEGMTAIIFND